MDSSFSSERIIWIIADSKIANLYFTYALSTLYAAAAPDVKGSDYSGPSGWKEMKGYPKKVDSNELSHDMDIAKKLWDVSEELTGVKYSF